jgi:signal transduction histidine kinase
MITAQAPAEPPRREAPPWWPALRWFSLWTTLGIAFTVRTYLVEQRLAEADPWDWWRSLRAELPDWYLWGLIALVVPRIARRFPLEPGRWRTSVPAHVVAGLGLTLAFLVSAVLVQGALRVPAGEPYPLWSKLVDNFLVGYLWNVVVYVAILGFTLTAQYRGEVQAQALRTAQLETRLAQARLDALALQLRPHFLFNTLNAVAELMHTDTDAADRMISHLAEVLRASLDAVGRAEVALEEELAVTSAYLEIQRARFEDTLRVTFEIAADASRAAVPSLVLLPLVENAVIHGVGSRPGPAHIGVRARREGDDLCLEVWDDGRGIATGGTGNRHGIGLTNTRERLASLYGRLDGLVVAPGPEGGVVSRLRIPFREVSS